MATSIGVKVQTGLGLTQHQRVLQRLVDQIGFEPIA